MNRSGRLLNNDAVSTAFCLVCSRHSKVCCELKWKTMVTLPWNTGSVALFPTVCVGFLEQIFPPKPITFMFLTCWIPDLGLWDIIWICTKSSLLLLVDRCCGLNRPKINCILEALKVNLCLYSFLIYWIYNYTSDMAIYDTQE